MSESQEAAEAVEEEAAAAEQAPAAEGRSAAEEAPAADAEVAEAEPSDEPDPEVLAAEEELAEEAIPTPVGPASGRQAKVFLCDRGHRTVAVWSAPTTCHARPTRSGKECGRQLYPIGALPEQVQKALNPLKASKKGSKA
ncbi:MAG TPA: hypothetical protein VK904_03745 [Miltoncostaeaceae bacterium]|nr:hypothetical protein [Miltoncostaeaceae bacterium]